MTCCVLGADLIRKEGPPIDDGKALTDIRFVLKSGVPWAVLPQEIGRGSGMSYWRRLRDWRARRRLRSAA